MSTDQPKGTLATVLFEPNAKLSDSLTYDITAWSLPFAYGLDALATTNLLWHGRMAKRNTATSGARQQCLCFFERVVGHEGCPFLAALLQAGIRVRHTLKPFTIDGMEHAQGSLIIAKADNKNQKDFLGTLAKIAKDHNMALTPTSTGFVEGGKDFGSSSVQMIPDIKVAVLYRGTHLHLAVRRNLALF